MTELATLEALLARVFEGTGPDRELDAKIEAWLTGRVTHPRNPGWTFEPQDAEWKLARLADSPFISQASRPAPPYTASLDAVLRDLLLKGWDWRRRSNLTMALVYGESEKYDLVAVHHEPCRALIAACLKARMEALGE